MPSDNLSAQVHTEGYGNSELACERWVDSVYSNLTREERVAQLLMIRANSVIDSVEINRIASWIRKYNLGGICFFKGGPVRQAILTNYYQSLARTPIMISMDAEWGLGMRLDSVISFARQMTLGAIKDESLILQYGYEMARQLRRIGVHVSFSPVADINNNPANPVINVRSFGEDKENVSRKSVRYMLGLQQGGVMSVAKHFPGHGDTDADSHYALPYIDHSIETIDTLDLYPFKRLIKAGVDGIMIAHLFIPALDTSARLPSSLSSVIINDLLKNKLSFRGLIFTDALDMKGAADFAPPGQLEVVALKAGNDVLLLPESVDSAIAHIITAVDSGLIEESMIEDRCRRILRKKYELRLSARPYVNLDNLLEDLNPPASELFNRLLYENAVTLLKNEDQLVPLARPDTLKIAAVTIGFVNESVFQQRLSSYTQVDHYTLPREPSSSQVEDLFRKLGDYNLLCITINNTHPSPARNFGFSPSGMRLADSLLSLKPSILTLFSLPYSLNLIRNAHKAKAILIGYQDNSTAYEMAAQLIFGGIAPEGTTPVSISHAFPVHTGLSGVPFNRFKFTIPEDAGVSSASLRKVDSLVMEGLNAGAYPGCQVLVARNGKVIYTKAFGYHDYTKTKPVKGSDLYDLASVTKVAATTLAVMKLFDEDKLDIRKPLSRYLSSLEHTNKSRITVQEVLSHQSGLQAWIPFFRETLHDGQPDTNIYRKSPTPEFPHRVANEMYIRKDYPAKLIDSIIKSPMGSKVYRYSDLGFILLQQVIWEITGTTLDRFTDSVFYRPLGLPTMGFLPLKRFSYDRIIPTENDTIFRRQLVHGDVHDPAAAMLGGVAGHAGLFGNATDLAVIFQMLLQHGCYGGRRYIDSSTVEEFTRQHFSGNRRGLGFDKPQRPGEEGPACSLASGNSFGHTGFTGTYVWADPDQQLIIVFLSNRVNPDAGDNKLARMGIRTRIQQAVYESITKVEGVRQTSGNQEAKPNLKELNRNKTH